ncbi:FAD-binding protein [Clostridia bacterium]|nr:FAD-binding protein [Clostridia bacterium]
MRHSDSNVVVIGSGCAGLNAADWLLDLGVPEVVMVTESMNLGTSRNTGSDKQTYYKLSLSGRVGDSPEAMANDLLSEGVNADTALAEAAGSAQAFFKLVSLGVLFPHNNFGEYVGYQTDHDSRARATSAGPLTSRYMTEMLEASARRKGLSILDYFVAFKIITHDGRVTGIICFDKTANEFHHLCCKYVVLATGGPAYIYSSSVYPMGHTGMTGMALVAGAAASNLHQWQYGLASTDFRWNVSGSYQQALPRYVSVDDSGIEREFLLDKLSPQEALRLTFLKGYQWPFDTRKIDESSQIDLLVHHQIHTLKRNVFMDFRHNPAGWTSDLQSLDDELREYLERSDATQSTPIARLEHMNHPAVELYSSHGIDLYTTPLRIDICAQHCNGGLSVDTNWQTTIRGLYAVGEVAGTFGAYRPGGSALNSTQVGSMRAAQHIARNFRHNNEVKVVESATESTTVPIFSGDVDAALTTFQSKMSEFGAHARDVDVGLRQLHELIKQYRREQLQYTDVDDPTLLRKMSGSELIKHIKLNDMLTTLDAVIDAMLYSAKFYGSTGAGLVVTSNGIRPHRDEKPNCVIETKINDSSDCHDHNFTSSAIPVRPFPERDLWFETVWKTFRSS